MHPLIYLSTAYFSNFKNNFFVIFLVNKKPKHQCIILRKDSQHKEQTINKMIKTVYSSVYTSFIPTRDAIPNNDN